MILIGVYEMDNSKNNKNKYDFKFKDFEAEHLTDIDKNKEFKGYKENLPSIDLDKKYKERLIRTGTLPKYLQERTIFLMDNDNKVLFNAFVKEKQWSKSQTLNHIIREFFKKNN